MIPLANELNAHLGHPGRVAKRQHCQCITVALFATSSSTPDVATASGNLNASGPFL